MQNLVLKKLPVILLYLLFCLFFLFSSNINAYTLEKQPYIQLDSQWEYREGDSPKNVENIPLYVLEENSNSNQWHQINTQTTTSLLNKSGSTTKTITVWFKIHLPRGEWDNPSIYFEKLYGHCIEVYSGTKKIYGQNRTFRFYTNKLLIPLEKDYYKKTLYIRADIFGLYKDSVGPKDKVLLGDFYNLESKFIKKDIIEIIFGFIFLVIAALSLFPSLFMTKGQRKTWVSLSLLILNIGIMAMFNTADFNMVLYDVIHSNREFFENSIMVLFEISRFTFTNLLIFLFVQIFDSKSKLTLLKKTLKVQNIYSFFCFILLLIQIITNYKISSIYHLCTFSILALFYIFEFLNMLITIIFLVFRKDIDAKIMLFGFSCLIVPFTVFFIIMISFNSEYDGMFWMLGVFIFILSLLTIAGRRIAEDHQRVVKYSSEIELSKNQLSELNKTLEQHVFDRTKELEKSNQELSYTNEELNAANDNLTSTLARLNQTQEYLIQSEKMAALGQLVAGIAHEINTPLGAIQASIYNISDYFNRAMGDLTTLLKKLTDEQQQLFFELISHSMNTKDALSSIEERALNQELTSKLKQLSVENYFEIADMLVDMGVDGDIEAYMPLFNDKDNLFIINTAYSFSGLDRNSKNIIFAIEKVSKMVFALKSYAHFDSKSKPVMTDVRTGLETVLMLYQNKIKHGVQVIKNYSEIPKILCYPDELNQVWTNIIHNGLHAMGYKGTLQIRVFVDGNYVAVHITDSGLGISPEINDKIFNPFFTTKPQGEGTGLGLDIVKRIIDKHKGSISFESLPGSTTFIILLPVS